MVDAQGCQQFLEFFDGKVACQAMLHNSVGGILVQTIHDFLKPKNVPGSDGISTFFFGLGGCGTCGAAWGAGGGLGTGPASAVGRQAKHAMDICAPHVGNQVCMCVRLNMYAVTITSA